MNKVAQNKKIIMAAKVMTKAVREEVEDILKDTEECVKKYIPARYVKASLVEVEKQLSESGIEAAFDKRVEKSAFKTTASQKPTGREIREVLNKVATAAIAEVEETLKETEDAANVIAKKLGKTANNMDEVEEKLKSIVEKHLRNLGVYARLQRSKKAMARKQAAREALVAKIRRAAAKKRIAQKLAEKKAAKKAEKKVTKKVASKKEMTSEEIRRAIRRKIAIRRAMRRRAAKKNSK